MRDIIHEGRDGEKLVSVIRRRGDRDRVRINSNPHPITPCRSAGDREDLEPEVEHEHPRDEDCEVTVVGTEHISEQRYPMGLSKEGKRVGRGLRGLDEPATALETRVA